MDFDISRLLADWEYQAGQVVVRRFRGKDGQDKIQLRVDLGILQMNAEGRPDGKRPFGYPSLLEYYQARLYKYVGDHGGTSDGFALQPEDCAKLQMEALQYHHRYICLLQLEDFAGVVRDAERNLQVFQFVAQHAPEEMAWSLRQFEPQLLMVLTRAQASQALKESDFNTAIQLAETGLERIREFYRSAGHAGAVESSPDILSLESWLEELQLKRPLSRREQLERALHDAVDSEDYERAAQVRDQLKSLGSDT